MRCELVEAPATTIANAVAAVAVDSPIGFARLIADPRDMNDSLAKIQGRFDRVRQA